MPTLEATWGWASKAAARRGERHVRHGMSAFCGTRAGPGLLQLADQDIPVSVTTSALWQFSSLSCGNVQVVQLTGMTGYLTAAPIIQLRRSLKGRPTSRSPIIR